MTTLNVENRMPDKLDYASPVQFRFKILKIPNVEFFVQSVNIPGITLGSAQQTNPLYDIPLPGDKITYASLDMSFLVDENLNNYKEIHDWILGLGFLVIIHNFKIYKLTVVIDFLVQQEVQLQQEQILHNL